MIKKCTVFVVALALLVTAIACSPTKGPAETGPVIETVESFYAKLNADVEILSVEMTDKDHAIVKVEVTYPPGPAHPYSDTEHEKVFLEKYGDEWEVAFAQ